MIPTAQSPFVQRLLTSKLLTPEQVQAAVAQAGEGETALADFLVSRGHLTRFQARQLKAGSTSLTVGKYVVVDLIGRGGNGIVLKARNRLMPDRYVALKTLDGRSLHNTEDALTRFRREIEIVGKLEHPNIVQAFDVIQTRTNVYLVLEYVAGRDLGSLVKERGPLPVTEAVDYAAQSARGLAYAHSRGIVHRDLKPTNLLLTRDGVVKLADLGLARFFSDEADDGLTVKGACLGTPEFMAPEQAEDARGADPRSDLYSLGATLFHLLTADLPVTGSSYLHKLQALLAVRPRPVAEVRPDLPSGLAEIVDRLRARDPADRPGSAEEVVVLLEPFTRGGRAPDNKPPRPDPKRLAALVVDVLAGRATAAEVGARYRLSAAEFETCRQRFLEAGERALAPGAPAAISQEEVNELHAKIGAQAMEIESLKKKLAARG